MKPASSARCRSSSASSRRRHHRRRHRQSLGRRRRRSGPALLGQPVRLSRRRDRRAGRADDLRVRDHCSRNMGGSIRRTRIRQPSPVEHVRSQRRRPHRPDRVPGRGRVEPARPRTGRQSPSPDPIAQRTTTTTASSCAVRVPIPTCTGSPTPGPMSRAGRRTTPACPRRGCHQDRGTTRTYTLTVADGQGGVSSDTVTIYVPLETDPWLGIAVPGTVCDAIVAGRAVHGPWSIYDPQARPDERLAVVLTRRRTDVHAAAGCQNLPPRTGQCVWQNPGPVSDLVRLRLVATSAARQFIDVSPRRRSSHHPADGRALTSARSGRPAPRLIGGGGWTDRRFRRRHLGDGGRIPFRVRARLRELRRSPRASRASRTSIAG